MEGITFPANADCRDREDGMCGMRKEDVMARSIEEIIAATVEKTVKAAVETAKRDIIETIKKNRPTLTEAKEKAPLRLIDISEARRRLKIRAGELSALITRGEIATVMRGKARKVVESSLDDYILSEASGGRT